MTELWKIRLGAEGRFEDRAKTESILSIDFGMNEFLTKMVDKNTIRSHIELNYSHASKNLKSSYTSQLNSFLFEMNVGDFVISPFQKSSFYLVGKLVSDYFVHQDGNASRNVEWLSTDIERSLFGQDLQYSLGAIMTICRVRRHDALRRIPMIAVTRMDPGIQEG